jgi:putative heme iron utilization protein
VTITGHLRPTTDGNSKARFLARHTSAEGYANFPDFGMYKLEVTGGHFIGGFGRIVSLTPGELLTDVAGAEQLIAAEPGIVEHMNSDHADAISLYATVLAGCEPGDWRMSGIDPAGADLLHCSTAARIEFGQPVRNAQAARAALVALVKEARERVPNRLPN